MTHEEMMDCLLAIDCANLSAFDGFEARTKVALIKAISESGGLFALRMDVERVVSAGRDTKEYKRITEKIKKANRGQE